MQPDALLGELARCGCTVTVNGDRLLVAPRVVLDDDLRAAIRVHKGRLLARLTHCGAEVRPPVVRDALAVFGLSHEAVTVRPLTGACRRLVCYFCRGDRFWRSVAGQTICARCHPPAARHLVVKWMDHPALAPAPAPRE